MIAHLSRRARAKAQEAISLARAASDANKAVLAALEGHSGPELGRRADAILDAAIAAHATVHDRLTTACRLSASSGRLAPAVAPTEAREKGEALFSAGNSATQQRRACA